MNKGKLFPNPNGDEYRKMARRLQRARLPETLESVRDWAKRNGVVDIAMAAGAKLRDIKLVAK